MNSLHHFADIHTHNLQAPTDAVINIDPTDGSATLLDGHAYSAGIHPWNARKASPEAIAELRTLAQHPQVVAIGEAGLDPLRGDVQTQLPLFELQARLAEEVAKPLIIHCVKRWDSIIGLRQALKPTQEWIIHGFRGKPTLAQQLLRAGFSISLGAKSNPATEAIIPPERLYRESDSPA